MDVAMALHAHSHLLEAVSPLVTPGRQGATFVGMAIALELTRRSPEKADKLYEILRTMRDGVLGNDELWADVAEAMEPILATFINWNGGPKNDG